MTADQLVVRQWRADDVPLLQTAVLESLDHLRPWMPWVAKEPLSLVERTSLVEGWWRLWDAGDRMCGMFVGDLVVGGCGLHQRIGPGGQAANVAARIAEHGMEARFVGKRADDAAGRLLEDELRGRGVDLAGPVVEGRNGVVVSLERFTRILSIDPRNLLVVVQPGVITGTLQDAVEGVGLFECGAAAECPADFARMRHDVGVLIDADDRKSLPGEQ